MWAHGRDVTWRKQVLCVVYKLKTIRSVNGKEFIIKSMQNRLRKLGIQHYTSTKYTLTQNGLVKQVNGTVVE